MEGELKQYLEARETMDLPPMSPIEATAAEQALAMVKPSGWNRDVEKEDFERRSDKRVPKQPHPLSFIELERHGFEHLIEPVMELGGPHKVYAAIGLLWLEPSEEGRWDPALKVTPFSMTLWLTDIPVSCPRTTECVVVPSPPLTLSLYLTLTLALTLALTASDIHIHSPRECRTGP
jgi:hypothetical protein